MTAYYDGWVKSSHRSVAACNDCHTPHNFFGKYATKALNGFFHSLAFTSGRFPDNIQIKPRNARVTEGACRSCHEEITSAIDARHTNAKGISCVRCHRGVGHGDNIVSNPHSRDAAVEILANLKSQQTGNATPAGAKTRSLAETGWTADGERFAQIEITAALGGAQRVAYITASGKRYEVK